VEPVRLPATLESIDDMARYVSRLARACGLSDREARRLRLAAEELITNTVVHGYGGRAGPPAEFELHGGVDRANVWLRVVDSAPAFDPTTVAPPADLRASLSERRPGGLGLYLARSAVDSMRYEYAGGCNRVTLVLACGGHADGGDGGA
jgi:serine/threonine-protein kinase RsbW